LQPRRTLERKLFGWLLVLALAPALALLAASLLISARSLDLLGTLGPWAEIAESGRALTDAIGNGASDSVVARAAVRHRAQLSESLVQANRWNYIGERLASAAPVAIALIAALLAVLAALLSRRLARELARPIGDLVSWAAALGEGRQPPPSAPGEEKEPIEIGVLRAAMRTAGAEIAESRARALDVERTRAWGEMARRIAHEMKNPLTPLRLAAYRLAGSTDGSNGGVAEAIDVIREETDRLDELARSFAMMGQPVTGPPTDVDLTELFATLLRTDVPAPITTTLDAPGTTIVRGHYDALVRAFRNILKNAVEAIQQNGGAGGIAVRIVPHPQRVDVTVADDGAGIPAGMAEAIFEPDRTLKAGGTGLGLAIVRQVVASHGGTVLARSREKGGAEFAIALPRDAGAGASPTHAAPGGEKRDSTMTRTIATLAAIALLNGCAVNLGGPKPEDFQTVALMADAGATAESVAATIRQASADIVLLTAEQDSAWFAAISTATGLKLSGPGATERTAKAFLTNLEILGDTSIVLGVADGSRMHMHDALYKISDERLIDLMLVGLQARSDLRDAARALLGYIATDVGANASLIIALHAPTPAAADSMAVLIRAAYSNAWECAGRDGAANPGRLRLFYGPSARIQCRNARSLEGNDAAIAALLVVER